MISLEDAQVTVRKKSRTAEAEEKGKVFLKTEKKYAKENKSYLPPEKRGSIEIVLPTPPSSNLQAGRHGQSNNSSINFDLLSLYPDGVPKASTAKSKFNHDPDFEDSQDFESDGSNDNDPDFDEETAKQPEKYIPNKTFNQARTGRKRSKPSQPEPEVKSSQQQQSTISNVNFNKIMDQVVENVLDQKNKINIEAAPIRVYPNISQTSSDQKQPQDQNQPQTPFILHSKNYHKRNPNRPKATYLKGHTDLKCRGGLNANRAQKNQIKKEKILSRMIQNEFNKLKKEFFLSIHHNSFRNFLLNNFSYLFKSFDMKCHLCKKIILGPCYETHKRSEKFLMDEADIGERFLWSDAFHNKIQSRRASNLYLVSAFLAYLGNL